ncbi:MAG: GWxTD domain-containing protein [Balneolaceae bacterium]
MQLPFSRGWLTSLIAGLLLLGACARASNPDIERGANYYFQDGYPEVRLSALGILNDEDQGVIAVAADIVESSLIYREIDGENQAVLEVEIQITGQEGTSFSETFTTQLQVQSEREAWLTRPDVIHFSKEMDSPPGDYQVTFSVTDLTSGNRAVRTTETFIPDPADNQLRLTSVRMLARDAALDDEDVDGYLPVTTYDVSTRNDSLRFVVQVTNNRSEQPLRITSRLIQFEADTSSARPMSFNNYTQSSLPYKGIDYSEDEVIDQTQRTLTQPGSVLIEYRYPRPDRGNYRFEVRANDSESEELFKARDFSVMGQNYPNLRTPRELAEPLIYLMDRRDHQEMLEITNPDSLKAEVDRFWLSNVGSQSQARRVISLYYERVEQANKQFTNFKEGWKTDMGMMYILFGAPWYVDTRLNEMLWSYAYDRSDPRYNFLFQRPRGVSEFFPFNNYLLMRDQSYFNIQYQQVERWLSGTILLRQL